MTVTLTRQEFNRILELALHGPMRDAERANIEKLRKIEPKIVVEDRE